MRRFVLPVLLAVGISLSVPMSGAQEFVARDQAVVGGVPGQPQMRTQQVPLGTASISGTVTAADTGEPVAGARVSLSGPSSVPATTQAPGANAPTSAILLGRGGSAPPPAGAAATPQLAPGLPLNRTVTTDAQGRFVFDVLPAGQFSLSVSHDLFLAGGYGQRAPNRPVTPFVLAEGERRTIPIRLSRGGVVTGTVYGPNGERQVRAQVRAVRYQWVNGVRRPQAASTGQSDDRGVYRIFGLQPGDYAVAATPPPVFSATDQIARDLALFESALEAARASAARSGGAAPTRLMLSTPVVQDPPGGFTPTYYPASPNLRGASVVTIKANEEHAGLDIRLMLARAGTVSGTVSGDLPPNSRVQVMLMSDDPESDANTSTTQVAPDGRFVIRNISPGPYTLLAQTMPMPRVVAAAAPGIAPPPPPPPPGLDDTPRLWARASVIVDGQSTPPVSLVLQPGRTISGMVVSEMTVQPPANVTTMVQLVTAASGQPVPQFGPAPQARVEADGRFTLTGVTPGRYSFRVNRGFTKSAVLNGDDTLDFPIAFTGDQDLSNLVITIGDRPAQLTGILTARTGTPLADTYAVLFPVDRRFWTPGSRRVLTTRPDALGRYTLRNMPAGDYLLALVADLEPGSHFDPDLLARLSGTAERVTIGDGASVTLNVRAPGAPGL